MAGSGFVYDTRRKLQAAAARIFPHELMNSIYTKILCGYRPDIKNPSTFNEKVQWLKLYYYPDKRDVINRTDKYRVRSVLEEQHMAELLPKLLFVCDKVEDIPWDTLPDKFVIKCNHGCAYNIICTDKSSFDIDTAKKELRKWMKQDFGLYNIEPHYSEIERRIFAEEYLGDQLIDYKFFCFNGEPKFLYVSKDLAHDSIAQIAYYDMDWNKLPLVRDDYADLGIVDKPNCYSILVDYCRKMAAPFPFVRIDFYVINEKPIFSEFTFTPSAGMMPITPKHFEADWGKHLDISMLERK